MTLSITPLTDTIGAELSGVDLAGDLSPDTRQAIYQAWVDNIVLVVRDQDLTPAQFVASAAIFGPIKQQNLDSFAVPEFPEINVVSSEDRNTDGTFYMRGVSWHSDHSYTETPPKATILYGIDIPSRGGDTQFCNMRAAYEELPEAERARLDGLEVLHVYESSRSPRRMIGRSEAEADRYPGDTVHPLVRTNPDTGRKAIYHNPVRAERVLDLDPEDSAAVLDGLVAYATQEKFQYRHKWRKGDYVIWDNRCAMHQANRDYPADERRYLHRLMIEGERPVSTP